MKIFSLFLGVALITSAPALASRHCKSHKYKTVAEQIANLDPKADLDIVDLDLFPGGNISAGYEYEVEPAYTKGLYARTDKWAINTKAVPDKQWEITEDVDAGISGGVRNQTQATFIRFMNDPCEAMLANPYSPRRIPLKTKVAIGPKFHIGDYFLFRGSVGFVLNAEILSLIGQSMWGVGLSGSFLAEGFSQLHIVRLDETHIRLKVIGHRERSYSASLGVGYQDTFEVFQVRVIDKQIERFINTKPVKLQASKSHTNVFMVDYVLDLSNQEVSDAFEKVLKKLKVFKNIQMARPFKDKDLEGNLILDLTPLEDLFRADHNNGTVNRIKRNLRTNSEQDAYGIGLDVGNKILGFKVNGGGAEAQMSIKNPGEITDRYLLKTWEKNWESRFLYSFMKNKESDRLSALFSSDEKFEQLIPVNVVREMSQKKNRYSYHNFQKLQMKLRKALPVEIYNDIPWDLWTQKPDQKFYNFGLRYELLMSPDSIKTAPELSSKDIKEKFREYMDRNGLTEEDYIVSAQNPDDFNNTNSSFDLSLGAFAKNLSLALDRKLPMRERLGKITKLKLNTLFAESGLGFIMTLQPDKTKQLFHLDLDISSNEAIIDYSYGEPEMSDLYKKILTIKAALDDDGLDLLREAESLSVKQEPEVEIAPTEAVWTFFRH